MNLFSEEEMKAHRDRFEELMREMDMPINRDHYGIYAHNDVMKYWSGWHLFMVNGLPISEDQAVPDSEYSIQPQGEK